MTWRARRVLAIVLLGLALASPPPLDAAGWGWLGVRIRDLSEQEMDEISTRHGILEGYGVLLVEVIAETPAARSGLRNGDLVVGFNGRPVADTRALQRLVGSTPVGERVSLMVLRTEGRRQVAVQVGAMPLEVAAERVAAEFGFSLRPRGQERGEAASGPGEPRTVGVVLRGSPAERSGLQTGDVIQEVNGHPVRSAQALSKVLGEASLDQPLRLVVRRGSESLSLSLTGPPRP